MPGFSERTKLALGQIPGKEPHIDVPLLEGLAVWTALLVVSLGLLSDIAVAVLDPRSRWAQANAQR